MNKQVKKDSNIFPIRTVSTITGVNAVTLRAWERRYNLIQPLRTKKGHRTYTQYDIDLINHIVELLNKGIAIGQVKTHLQQAPQPTQENELWRQYQQRMTNAIVRFDDRGLDATYNDTLALYPVDMVTQKLIQPLLKSLGERWAIQQGSIAEEHFFGCYLRNKLGARYHHEASRAQGPLLLTACLPGEHHETGLLLASLSLMAHGYRTLLLGADLPLKELIAPAQHSQAKAILLSGSITPPPSVLEDELPTLVQQTTLPIYIGGHTSVVHRDAIVSAGAIPIGTDINHALSLLDAAFAQGGKEQDRKSVV